MQSTFSDINADATAIGAADPFQEESISSASEKPNAANKETDHPRERSLDHDDYHYRIPSDLTVIPTVISNVLIIGSCLASGLPDYIQSAEPNCKVDYVLFNNLSELPKTPPQAVATYDFQLIQLAIRSVLPDHLYFRAPYGDLSAWEQVFEQARERMSMLLEAAMQWNVGSGLLTFVSNLLLPQQNAHGRLLPRYDLRNPVYLIERLNQCLCEEVSRYANAHVLDMNDIAATFGRKYIQDDGVWPTNHGAVLSDVDFDRDQMRIAAIPAVSAYYTLRSYEFIQALWAEVVGLYRIVRQSDAVKLVIVDLDDTLWRGVAAEIEEYPPDGLEGWPLGLVEAIGFVRQRGILLAIVSKNEENTILRNWEKIFQGRLAIEDFAARRINWEPKSLNVQSIVEEINVLPRSVLFIDDNPVERESVKASMPEIRVLGANQYYLRRILLWSSEMQVPLITDESSHRTQMIQSNNARTSEKIRLTRPEFLATLEIQMHFSSIGDGKHRLYPRAFELLNKTNQFNTTGGRWTHEELQEAFGKGAYLHAFEVEDRFSKYGLVGVLIVLSERIEQMVMSCRVVGLDVEFIAVSETIRLMREQGAQEIRARLVQTSSNLLCQTMFERCGLAQDDEEWCFKAGDNFLSQPSYIKVV